MCSNVKVKTDERTAAWGPIAETGAGSTGREKVSTKAETRVSGLSLKKSHTNACS